MTLSDTYGHFLALFGTFVTLLSWFSEVIEDGADLTGGEILAVGVIACGFQLLLERRIAIDPAHQVAGCRAGVAVGEVKKSQLLLCITSDFHFNVEC